MILNCFKVILVVGRSSVGPRSVVGRSSVDPWSVIGRWLIDCRSVVGRLSVGRWLIIGWSLVDDRSVVGRHALRVSPAVTRLTVYRRLQVIQNTCPWKSRFAWNFRDFSEVFWENLEFSAISNYFRDFLYPKYVIAEAHARGFASL